MFKDRASDVSHHGAHGGAAALSHAQILGDPLPGKTFRFAALAERYEQWRQRASMALSEVEFAPDLAREIGSRRWLRGAATMVGLTALALAGWPDFAPLRAAPAMRIDEAARDEFRSQMIMPLALGGDSGRHMGATREVVRLKGAPERPRLDLVATLGVGDSFERMLRRAGVSDTEAGQIAGLVAGAMPLGDIASGTQIDLTLGRRPSAEAARPLDSLSFRARFDLQLAVERVGGRLALEPHPITVDTTPLRIRGVIGTSLYRSARAAGAPASAVQEYLRTLDGEMDLDNLAAGDEFDLIVDYKRAATGETEAGKLLYVGLIRGGKPRKQLMRWGADGKFYEASGVGETRQGLMRPVPGWETSGYGMRRHPVLGYTRMHRGIDFHAPYGSPIYAVSDGTVEFAGRHGGHGNFVKLGHGGGLETGYAHMSRIAVTPGERVRRGEVIGYVGSTGLSTGAHLHFEVYRNGEAVNPATVTYVNRAQLSGAQLAAFRSTLAELQRIQPGAALTPLTPDPIATGQPVREIDRIDAKQKVS
uniref:M23 family metallopeptidase n=1 Tax=Altererythrobacter segetis TaxID=1104773 RepID=UPI001FB01E8D|nr:M23 family metallopeptidase [Altererythrobacter segetis]